MATNGRGAGNGNAGQISPATIGVKRAVGVVPDKDGGIDGRYAQLLSPRTGASDEATLILDGGAPPLPLTKRMRRVPSAMGLVQPLVSGQAGGTNGESGTRLVAGQVHENDLAEFVLVCEPGLPKMMGSLHPCGSLYERPVDLSQSIKQHRSFRELLKSHGIQVLTVASILKYGTDTSVKARIELEDLAAERLTYELDPSCNERLMKKEDLFYIGDAYKRSVLEALGADQLVEIVLTNPTVRVQPSFRDTGFTAEYSFRPLSNLVFTRDQQISTAKGVVMGRLRSEQRRLETSLMRFILEKIGINPLAKIDAPGFLEGGDFFAAGLEMCFVGIGLRSNFEAVQQCLDQDLFGTRRVAVVKDDKDHSQDRMHLDCVFSILSEDCVLMLKSMMGEASPRRRLVDEYTKGHDGKYKKTRSDIELSKYVTENDYHIVPIDDEHQLKYGCNVLNLGGSNIISVHKESARQIARSPHFHGNVEFLEYDAITSMYGAVHCSSQVLIRRPIPNSPR